MIKKILLIGFILLVIGAIVTYFIFTDSYADTKTKAAAFTVNANSFIKEFEQNDSLANKKYAEQLIVVKGIVSEIEPADTSVNIKMIDTVTNAYINFAFQDASINEAKSLKVGDSVFIKGSCSGGAYSDILETEYITFKRCTLNK
jgi:signal peptidase I